MKSVSSLRYMGAAATIMVFALTACDNDSANGPDNIVTGQITPSYYYQIDTEQQQIVKHTSGQCNTHFEWDTTVVTNIPTYNYTLSGDILSITNVSPENRSQSPETSSATYVRISGTPGSLDGTWMYSSETGMCAKKIATISGTSFEETCEISPNFDFMQTAGMYYALKSVFTAQDGGTIWGEGASFLFFAYDPSLYLTQLAEITIISKTSTSIEFTRNGRTFLLEILNPQMDDFSYSVTYRITSNGKTCTSNYKRFDITREACSMYYPEPAQYDNSDGIIYNVNQSNQYEFRACFEEMFK